jgi:L-ascorbate metabolism protein UlaG (beta-lactamase superfamily)
MIITHYGAEFFKVSFGDITLAFNPISKKSKLDQTRFGADVALVSLNHSDMNGVEQVAHGGKTPFEVFGPGEYEVSDVLIKGYQTKSEYGGTELINTAYLVKLEKMMILFLGALSSDELPKDLKEVLDKIDILFVPIGGDGVLSPKKAYDLSVSIAPKMIIPMHYGKIGEKDALENFLKEDGSVDMSQKPIDKLTVKNKDLDGKENEIIIFAQK